MSGGLFMLDIPLPARMKDIILASRRPWEMLRDPLQPFERQ
jgi:hypothetical protein